MQQLATSFMKSPLWLYLIGWCIALYLFIALLTFNNGASSNLLLVGFGLINFGIHEVAHIALSFLPPIAVAMAGSIAEILFPIIVLLVALRTKAYFSVVFISLWVMMAVHHVGIYMADARSLSLPLMGPGGGELIHDWNFIFNEFGWLQYDTAIGGGVYIAGTVIGVAGLLFGAFLIIKKITLLKKTKSNASI